VDGRSIFLSFRQNFVVSSSDGGRFASSDLNGLYCRVIIRINRLKAGLLEIKAPEVIRVMKSVMLQGSYWMFV